MSSHSSAITKQALLTTGRRLFGSLGYDGGSLRLLAQEAGVNLAMVNYHFGSKFVLYEIIVDNIIVTQRHIVRSPNDITRSLTTAGNDPNMHAKVAAWHIEHIVHSSLTSPANTWAQQLIEHERANPTACFCKLEEQLFFSVTQSIRLLVSASLENNATTIRLIFSPALSTEPA